MAVSQSLVKLQVINLTESGGLINLKKEFVTQAEFESLIFSGADRVVAVKKISSIAQKMGSLTLSGSVTIPFQYDAVKNSWIAGCGNE